MLPASSDLAPSPGTDYSGRALEHDSAPLLCFWLFLRRASFFCYPGGARGGSSCLPARPNAMEYYRLVAHSLEITGKYEEYIAADEWTGLEE